MSGSTCTACGGVLVERAGVSAKGSIFAGRFCTERGCNSTPEWYRIGEAREALLRKHNAKGVQTSCEHGERKAFSGIKGGKTWLGFFCPKPREAMDKCTPVFVPLG